MEDHDWHMFDVERGLEVKCESGYFYMRKSEEESDVVVLTPEEFDAIRSGGPLPEGLE